MNKIIVITILGTVAVVLLFYLYGNYGTGSKMDIQQALNMWF